VRRTNRLVALTGLCVAMSACSILGDDKDESLEPVELVKFKQTLKIKRIWSADLGGDSEFLRVALQPVGDGNRIYAASYDGKVSAFDPASGKRLWRTDLDLNLSAGPGSGDGFLAVATVNGEIILLDAADGTERWRVDIDGEALARPIIANDSVYVQTVDNRLRSLKIFDGSEEWVVLESMPALTMRGSASPVVSGNNIVAGFDNGYIIAVDMDTGDTAWRALMSPPTGRSDLDRLSDIDGTMTVIGQDIYAAGYQGRLGSIAAESGQVLWATEISSYVGVSADWTSLYTAQDDGAIIAVARRNGAEAWRQEALLRREPTLPVPFHTAVAVGDFDGYIHFMSNLDGELVARVRLDGSAVTGNPLVVADRLYVQSDSGKLAAYIVDEPERKQDAPDVAETPDATETPDVAETPEATEDEGA
jgi:outer membrane protein assembly factor BamB